jgi:hypothetical protein
MSTVTRKEVRTGDIYIHCYNLLTEAELYIYIYILYIYIIYIHTHTQIKEELLRQKLYLRAAVLARKASLEILSWNMLEGLRKPRNRSVRTAYFLTHLNAGH